MTEDRFDLGRFKRAVQMRLPSGWDDPRTDMRHVTIGMTPQERVRYVNEAYARRKLILEAERYGEEMHEARE